MIETNLKMYILVNEKIVFSQKNNTN